MGCDPLCGSRRYTMHWVFLPSTCFPVQSFQTPAQVSSPASGEETFSSFFLLATFPLTAGSLEVWDGELLQRINSWIKLTGLFYFYGMGYN